MAEIRDITPAEPVWPKRRIDRIQPEGDARGKRKDKPPRPAGVAEEGESPDAPGDRPDDGHEGHIDEYA